MGVPCSICVHPKRDEIEAMCRAEMQWSKAAAHFGVKVRMVGHHARRHMVIAGIPGNKCATCAHPCREEIERDLLAGVSQGEIIRRYPAPRFSPSSLTRHKLIHLKLPASPFLKEPCRTCTHPEVETINQCLEAGELGRTVAARYGLSELNISRHKRRCLLIPKESKRCLVCRHSQRARIEADLIAHVSINSITKRYHIGWDTVVDHKLRHLSPLLEKETDTVVSAALAAEADQQQARPHRRVGARRDSVADVRIAQAATALATSRRDKAADLVANLRERLRIATDKLTVAEHVVTLARQAEIDIITRSIEVD